MFLDHAQVRARMGAGGRHGGERGRGSVSAAEIVRRLAEACGARVSSHYRSAVHIPSMADLDHGDGFGAVIDGVQYAVVALPSPILLLA